MSRRRIDGPWLVVRWPAGWTRVRRDPETVAEASHLLGVALKRLGRTIVCSLPGQDHDWSDWHVDDVDGPAEYLGDGDWLPLTTREARATEDAMRSCARCGVVEARTLKWDPSMLDTTEAP